MRNKTPIQVREDAFKVNPDIWNTKIRAGELDIYKPSRGTLASWISEVERNVGTLRFHPAWGRACTENRFIVWKETTDQRKAA